MANMKRLMEAVSDKPISVDQPFKNFKNTPNEQTTDSKTMNDIGDDLNRKKNAQFRSKEGDNPMAMTTVKVKTVQEQLTRKYAQFKLNEMRIEEEMGLESPTLAKLDAESSKTRNHISSGVDAKVLGPTPEYPAPWSAVRVHMSMYEVQDANKQTITGFLNQREAEQIVSEVNGK